MNMRYGEMKDMISCVLIAEGGAEQDIQAKKRFEDVVRMK